MEYFKNQCESDFSLINNIRKAKDQSKKDANEMPTQLLWLGTNIGGGECETRWECLVTQDMIWVQQESVLAVTPFHLFNLANKERVGCELLISEHAKTPELLAICKLHLHQWKKNMVLLVNFLWPTVYISDVLV